MLRLMFKSKIHRLTVTDANLEYEGSLSLDAALLKAADILPFEQIHVWNVTRGTRLTTYALEAPAGSGTCCVNGAGAHLVEPGDIVIVATFTEMADAEARRYVPNVVLVDELNRVKTQAEFESVLVS
jgi:aspartate 1-decarboxylase